MILLSVLAQKELLNKKEFVSLVQINVQNVSIQLILATYAKEIDTKDPTAGAKPDIMTMK